LHGVVFDILVGARTALALRLSFALLIAARLAAP
jgi:hypothetical protein